MNRVILQIWEESDKNDGIFNDGCSVHIDEVERNTYISNVYKNRESSNIPQKYERVVGGEIEIFASDSLYDIILREKSIRLSEVEFNNLLKFEDLIYNYATI